MSAEKGIQGRVREGVTVVQSLHVEGKNGLLSGGYPHATMTARELLGFLRQHEGIAKDTKISVIGVGATAGLWDEITYDGENLLRVFGSETGIRSEPLDLDTKISFSQIALSYVEGLTRTIRVDAINASGKSDEETYEINNGGTFKALLEKIGGINSSVITITAKTDHIKTRAVCPVIEETGQKVTPTLPLGAMVAGSVVIRDGDRIINTYLKNPQNERAIEEAKQKAVTNGWQVQNIKVQDIRERRTDTLEEIRMVGVITGTGSGENKALTGIHFHCKHGHVLALGNLKDVEIQVTPVAETKILLPERTQAGELIWHNALSQRDVDGPVKMAQRLWRARQESHETHQQVSREAGQWARRYNAESRQGEAVLQ